MITLYEFAPTRSIRARWVLQELGVEFQSVVIDLRRGEHQSPQFLAVNPAGKVPALVDGGLVLTESVAIVLYLAERFPDRGLLPQDAGTRAQVYRWLLFTVTELEQPLWRITRHTFLYPEARRLAAEVELARDDFKRMAPVLEAHLDGRVFVAGDAVTVADFVLAYTLDWANELTLLEEFPRLRSYFERMYERPQAAPRIAQAFASVNDTSRLNANERRSAGAA
jgi:glutathione S-transferase